MPMRRPARRILLVLLAAAAILEALYLLAANAALSSSLLEARLNRHPERFHISWQSAWTFWPGTVSLRGVEVGGSSKHQDWYAHLDSVGATFQILPLRHNTVHLILVHATGADYRQRRKEPTGLASRVPTSELPPIPPVTAPGAPPSAPPPGPRSKLWTVLADEIVCDMDQIWIDRFRIVGPLRVATGMMLVPRQAMEFPGIRLSMASGELRAGEERIFEGLGMDVQATVHRFVPHGLKHLEFFHYLSGRFFLKSESASLFFLQAYFRKTPWVQFHSRGSGNFRVLMDHGRLRPGTLLELRNDHGDLEFLDRRLKGKGLIRGVVEANGGKPTSLVTARLSDFQVLPVDRDKPFARGDLAVLAARSESLDLTDPFSDLKVIFDVPHAEMLDLTFYNHLIPEGSKFKLLSGTGTMSYHLEGSQEERSLHGTIDLNIDQGSASFRDFVMRGGFSVNALLRQASPRELLFDIAGTRIEVRKRNPDWKASFFFPKARMHFTDPTRIDATLRLEMQDTRPLVVMFDALKGVPSWLERMMTIADIRGTAELRGRGDQVGIQDVDITGESLHALADLSLGKKSREGILYLHFHGFSFGVDLKPEGKDIRILRPLRWFHAERARRHGMKDSASAAPGSKTQPAASPSGKAR